MPGDGSPSPAGRQETTPAAVRRGSTVAAADPTAGYGARPGHPGGGAGPAGGVPGQETTALRLPVAFTRSVHGVHLIEVRLSGSGIEAAEVRVNRPDLGDRALRRPMVPTGSGGRPTGWRYTGWIDDQADRVDVVATGASGARATLPAL